MTRRLLFLALLFIGTGAMAQEAHHEDPPPVQQGGRAPAFGPLGVLNAKAAGKTRVSFGEANDRRPWVISLMAAWCPGCVNELPMLARLDEAYRGRGVQVLSVSIDDKAGTAALQRLLTQDNIRYPVAIDADHKVLQQYQGPHRTSLPFLLVIDKTGTVRLLDEGFSGSTEGEVRALLESLLVH